MKRVFLFLVFSFALAQSKAQFRPDFLANESYWGDGKAEFDFYDAPLMRDGQPRQCELLMIFTREKTDPQTFVRITDSKRTGAINAIRMNQIWTAPIGMFVEQGSLTGLWRTDGSLAQLMLIAADSFGNSTKKVESQTASSSSVLHLVSDSYRDGTANRTITPPPNAVFYDELALRVRTIDWKQKPFEIQLSAPLHNAGTVEFKPAKISWSAAERSIQVNVQHAGGQDTFRIDPDFPFLLREWQLADGSKLKLKRSLKADYWNYSKNGDRERALKNPMLQHPD